MFAFAMFKWKDGGHTFLFAQGGRSLRVGMMPDGVTKVAFRHPTDRFDSLCHACETFGATEIEPTQAQLDVLGTLTVDMASPGKKMARLLSLGSA